MTLVMTPLAVGQPHTTHAPLARHRRYLMCRPSHFDVTYAINPWMRPGEERVDPHLAMRQWHHLLAAYTRLGHEVHVIEDAPGLPDMVFAANAGLVLDGRVLLARFHHHERTGEEALYRAWFEDNGFAVHQSERTQEGEGDLLVVGPPGDEVILAGTGFRTDLAAHAEVAAWAAREVVTLHLVDPSYYHLDTALAPLDDHRVVWFPGAFSDDSTQQIRRRYPDSIEASADDAAAFGLNACSDGRNVVLAASAVETGLAARLEDAGFVPVPVDLGELRKSGGSAKCCTLELRA